MIDIGALQGSVTLNGVDNAIKGVKGMVEEIGRGGRSLSDFEKGLKNISESAEKLGKDLTLKVSAPLAGLGATAYKLASDFEETLSKTDAVFKDTSGVIREWASTSIESMGMAQATALDMASGFGAMGSSIGLAKEQTDTYAMSLTQLASDLSSFHNMSLEQVKTALNGVFTGETESLKQLGIAMTVTNLEAYALTQGIEKQWKEMTQAEQVQLRYNYVLNATKDAQGDFARTSDSSANQLKILVESLKELGTTMGEEIVPIITPIVSHLNEAINSFGELDQATKQNIIQFGLFATATPVAITAVGKLVGAVNGLLGACKSLALFLSANPYAVAITALAGVAIGATAILVDYFTWSDQVAEKMEQTSHKIEQLKKGIYNTDDAKKELEAVELVAMKYERLTNRIAENEKEVKRLEGSSKGLKAQLEAGTIATDEYNSTMNANSEKIRELQVENSNYKVHLDEVRETLITNYGSEEKAIEYKNELARTIKNIVVPSLTQQQQAMVSTANIHAETGKAIVFNSSQQAQAEIDNIYATIKALEAKQKAIIAQAKSDGAYEEELRQAEASHTAIRMQIESLTAYKNSVQSSYDALIVSEQALTDTAEEENKKRTDAKKEAVKTEEELHEEALKRLTELQNEETKVIEEAYKVEREASEAHYNAERETMEEAYKQHMETLEDYCKRRYEELEKEYEGEKGLLTGLYDELDAFDQKEADRKKAEKEQSYKDKIESLENELYKAKTVEERIKIEAKLKEEEKRYADYLAEEKRKAERQEIVDRINATKAEYEEKKAVIKEENEKLKKDAEEAHKVALEQLEADHKEELNSITARLDAEKQLVITYSEEELTLKKKQRDEVKAVQEETTRNNRTELEKQLADMKSLQDEMRQAGINNAKAYQDGLKSVSDSLNQTFTGGYIPPTGRSSLRSGELAMQQMAQTTAPQVQQVQMMANDSGAIESLRSELMDIKATIKQMPSEQNRLKRMGAV